MTTTENAEKWLGQNFNNKEGMKPFSGSLEKQSQSLKHTNSLFLFLDVIPF